MRARALVRPIAAAVVAAGIVVLGAIGAAAAASEAATAGWSQYQADAQHTGVAVSAPSAPFRVAWSTPTGIGDVTHYAGIPAPVIAGENAIIVDREDVTAVSLTSGIVAWTTPRELGPSAPAAVAPSAHGATILFTEGGGDLSSSASGTPTPSPTASTPTPSASGSPNPTAGLHSTLVALNAETRRVLWRRALPGVSFGGPTVDASTVLVGTDDGSVTAVSLDSGDQEWSVDLGESVLPPIAASDGVAYVAVGASVRQQPSVVALHEGDGSQIWSSSAFGLGVSIGAPAFADGRVFVGSNDGAVRALDARTGASIWIAKLNTASGIGAPAVSDDSVVIVDRRGQVYRFAPATGERLWDFAMNVEIPVSGSTAIAGSAVLVGDSDGNISAIDLETGDRIWRENVGEGALLGVAVSPGAFVASRTGPSAGLVEFVADPTGVLINERSPTIVEPVDLGAAWLIAAVPLVAILILAGRFLESRLGPATFPSDDDGSEGPKDDDLA